MHLSCSCPNACHGFRLHQHEQYLPGRSQWHGYRWPWRRWHSSCFRWFGGLGSPCRRWSRRPCGRHHRPSAGQLLQILVCPKISDSLPQGLFVDRPQGAVQKRSLSFRCLQVAYVKALPGTSDMSFAGIRNNTSEQEPDAQKMHRLSQGMLKIWTVLPDNFAGFSSTLSTSLTRERQQPFHTHSQARAFPKGDRGHGQGFRRNT